MRITGGQDKGRRLSPLKGLRIRPTSDRVREAIFSLVGQDMKGVSVLDLFAGSGSLGIEALSRGARWAVFIDNTRQSIGLLRRNLASCGYEHAAFVLLKDLSRGLPEIEPLTGEKIDLVFMDPPYGKNLILPVLREIYEKRVLASPALLVVKASKFDVLPVELGKIRLVTVRAYGETRVYIYRYEDME
jgi:16S rRNA (guanine966-N2)-methyltransferase